MYYWHIPEVCASVMRIVVQYHSTKKELELCPLALLFSRGCLLLYVLCVSISSKLRFAKQWKN